MAFVPIYILILGFTIVIDYYAGIYIEKSERRKKSLLVVSLVANIGVLAVFKYYNFINDNISWLLHGFMIENPIPYLKILLPIGLSFHTFQAMSYTIEVYRGNQKAEKHFGIYALYVMFYPQLVAGPIERPQNILFQFHREHSFNYDLVTRGLKMILWGFFKKLVVADRLAIYVNAVYNNNHQHSSISLIVATLFFSIQIYCDFSGYSDIALGSAKIMGFDLMPNFNRPYFSQSIREFWSRWHISLSMWFRDYLYIPLGGNRVSKQKQYRNLVIVFLVSGIWHGANWTYVIWGGLHGIYLITAQVFPILSASKQEKLTLKSVLHILSTISLTSFAWIFFRALSVEDAFSIVYDIFTLKKGTFFIGTPSGFIYSIIGIFVLFLVEIKQEYYPDKFTLLYSNNILIRIGSYTLLVLIILLIGALNGGQFIYFEF